MRDEEWVDKAEEGLMQLIEGAEVQTEKLDKDGCPHTLTAKLPPNIDAIKFALKNRSKGKWADKTEVTHTQINVNLTASYNEVQKLMEQEKQKLKLAQKDEQIIEAEIINADNKADR